MEIGKRLRQLRRERGLRQSEVADLTGIGQKTISSFETGDRTDRMKVDQLQRLLSLYGVSPAEFFGDEIDRFGEAPDFRASHLVRRLTSMPAPVQEALLAKIQLMVDTADDIQAVSRPRPYTTEHHEWQMLTSQN